MKSAARRRGGGLEPGELAAAERAREAADDAPSEAPDLTGDWGNLLLLLLLYTLQGVPMGLASSVQLILQEKSVSYADQGAPPRLLRSLHIAWQFLFSV